MSPNFFVNSCFALLPTLLKDPRYTYTSRFIF